jgi:hypothetical protein
MNPALIFLPVLAQMLLTLLLYVALQGRKKRAVLRGEVDAARRALHEDAWPDEVRQVNNNIRNQFELPVLFYVLCLALFALQASGWLAQALAWGFVASRIVHAWVHTRSNVVPLRRRVFIVGVLLVFALWLVLAWRVLAGALA